MSKPKPPHHWIPLSFIVFGVLLSWLAFERKGLYWPLLWPAADCAAVGAAYFRKNGARVFGKHPDGSRSVPIILAMLPFLAVIWVVWRAQVLLSPEDCSNEPVPGLFIGRRPLPGEHATELSLVVDLTSEFPKPDYHPPGVEYACLPTLDAFVPEAEAFHALIEKAAASKRVLVHCANGHGRSAAFTAALLVRRGLAKDIDAAMALICAVRPACRLNPAQRAAAAG